MSFLGKNLIWQFLGKNLNEFLGQEPHGVSWASTSLSFLGKDLNEILDKNLNEFLGQESHSAVLGQESR